MTEANKIKEEKMQQNDEKAVDTKAEEITVKLDFFGEEQDYSLEEVKELAKKGYNYDLISNDWERLKNMAFSEGKSVCEYLNYLSESKTQTRRKELVEKCADEELAEYVLNLENKSQSNNDNFFGEMSEYFPKIKDISELPLCVVENAKIKGSRILDEWLRYRHKKQIEMSAFKNLEKLANESSIGPQREFVSADYDPAKLQFIKGIWGK